MIKERQTGVSTKQCKDCRKRIALVVACTKRKRGHVTPEMLFHTLGRRSADLLADEWIKRMKRINRHCLAERLYSGAGWMHTLTARAAANEKLGTSHLYILSAGFGLLRSGDLIPPYSATFAPDEDQVARQVEAGRSVVEAHREWWKAINLARGEETSSVFSEICSHEYILVAAGVDYIRVIQNDLTVLASTHTRDQLFVISIGASPKHLDIAVQPYLLPIDICIERTLPGPRSTINQRTLEWVVGTVIPKVFWDRSAIETEMDKELASWRAVETELPKRELVKIDDTRIKLWISYHLMRQPDMSKQRLLRVFRQSRSCEQKRFYRLVDDVRRKAEVMES